MAKKANVIWFSLEEREPNNEDLVLVSDGEQVFPAVWNSDELEDGSPVAYFEQIGDEFSEDAGTIWSTRKLWWCYLPDPMKW